jgi:Glycosyl transferase family 2
VEDSDLLARIRQQAYDTIRSELPMSRAAEQIAEAVASLGVEKPRRDSRQEAKRLGTLEKVTHVELTEETKWLENDSREPINPVALFPQSDPELALVRRALKEIRLDLMDVRRLANQAIISSQTGTVPVVRPLKATAAAALNLRPRVSILTALYNHGSEIIEALDSLLLSEYSDWEIVVVNDGSSDGGVPAVSAWADRHPEIALKLVSHPVNRGLAHARNTALDYARGELAFVLDSDNAVYPKGISFKRLTPSPTPASLTAYSHLFGTALHMGS